MSYEVSTSVWMVRIPPLQKLVLLYFANIANEDGDCVFKKGKELTKARLAYLTCLSEKTIQRVLSELLDPDTGLLEIVRPAMHHSPPEYRVLLERLDALNKITRGDCESPLKGVEKRVEKLCKKQERNPGGGTHSPSGGTHSPSGGTHSPPTINVFDVRDVKGTYCERETIVKDLRRLFGGELVSIPAAIPTDRLFVFWRKLITGQVRRSEIRSPVGFLLRMADEDPGPYLEQYRAAIARGG